MVVCTCGRILHKDHEHCQSCGRVPPDFKTQIKLDPLEVRLLPRRDTYEQNKNKQDGKETN